MNSKSKTITIVLVVIALLGGGYFYFTNGNFKNAANGFVEKTLLGKEEPAPVAKTVYQNWIYYVADGTGDCYIKYAIPKVELEHLSRAADSIHHHNGGRLWLSYFDNDSKNNLCIYLNVSAGLVKQAEPKTKNGETSFEADDKMKVWEKATANFSTDSLANEKLYQQQKGKFLKECEAVLTSKVYVKGLKENLWSDIVGGLNSSFKTFNAISDTTPAHKYVVAFSDLQDDAPYLKPKPTLESIPSDVKVIAVNPAPGSSKKCTQEVTELEAPERVFETIFKNQ